MKITGSIAFFLLLSFALYSQNDQVKYKLTLDTVMLGNVTVSSTIPLNNSQVDKFYRVNYFSTIDNLTERLDGMSLIKRGAYAMEPQLNGFSSGQLNITIDGMKMFGACTDKMDPVTSYLEPENLMTMTIEHGTNGCIHGNNTGGSIDMSLQAPGNYGTNPFSASLSTGYETVSNSRNLLLSAGSTGRRWAWIFNGVYRKNGLYRDGRGGRVNFSQFGKYNAHSAIRFSADSVSSLRADLLWDLALNVGYPALPMDVSRARAGLVGLEYQRTLKSYNLKARIYFNSVFHRMDDSARDSLFFIHGTDPVIMRMDMPGWSRTFGSYVQSVIKLDEKNELTVKADNYINYSLAEMTMHMHYPGSSPEPPMYLQTWPDISRNVTGLYVSNTTRLGSKSSITINGRLDFGSDRFRSSLAADQFSVFNILLARKYDQFTKGANLIFKYQLAHSAVISVQTGFSERVPTISERYGFYLYNAYDGYDYIGNPNLKTEKSLASRLMFTWFNNGLKINISQSFNFLGDYILGITDTVIPPMNFYTRGLRVYRNISGVKLFSTDLQVMYKPVPGFTFFMITKYSYGQIGSSAPLPLIPPLKNTISLSYEIRRWSFMAENETALKQGRINTGYGESVSPGYTIINLRAGFHFMFKESMADIGAGITNLLNAYYYEHLDWGHIPRPGRSLSMYLKIKY